MILRGGLDSAERCEGLATWRLSVAWAPSGHIGGLSAGVRGWAATLGLETNGTGGGPGLPLVASRGPRYRSIRQVSPHTSIVASGVVSVVEQAPALMSPVR